MHGKSAYATGSTYLVVRRRVEVDHLRHVKVTIGTRTEAQSLRAEMFRACEDTLLGLVLEQPEANGRNDVDLHCTDYRFLPGGKTSNTFGFRLTIAAVLQPWCYFNLMEEYEHTEPSEEFSALLMLVTHVH